ncbi:MAG: hypothetical protein QOJ98_1913 [Acidobacteriota bacterium]|jgi:hypothetical protein|nr:hypothetical protein [Acidobacteriota bacterium]
MPLDETFTNLAAFLNSLDAEGEQKFELSHSLVIICPDCGKNIAFRGRCPKCAGNSWIPAGHANGIFERTKAQRLRRMIADDDVTLRGTSRDIAPEVPALEAPAVEVVEPTVATDETVVDTANGRKRRKRNH